MRRLPGPALLLTTALLLPGVLRPAAAGPGRGDGGRAVGTRVGPGPGVDGRSNAARRGDEGFTVSRRGSDDRRGRGHRWNWWPYYSPFWPGYGGLGYRSPFYDPFRDPYYDSYFASGGRTGRSSGNVDLNVSPSDASVYVNGVSYGTSRNGLNLPVGVWRIELRASGCVPQTVELKVEQGVHYSIERRLERDRTLTPRGKPLKVEEL